MTDIEAVDFVIVGDDDWEGLYINGKLHTEGHSLSSHDILVAAKGKLLRSYEHRVCNRVWLSDHGNLPDNLGDVKWPK